MSVEALLLLALFVLLPLIQQVVRATRQRNRRGPELAERQAPGTPQPLARTPLPPELAVPPLPDATPQAASDAMPAGGRMPAPEAGGPVTRALAPDRTMGRRTTAGLRTRVELRRAIVLVAMLGPCRASNPYDWPEHTGRP